MKITIESYGNKYSTETENDDLDIHEVVDILKGLLVSSGFGLKTVLSGFGECEDE